MSDEDDEKVKSVDAKCFSLRLNHNKSSPRQIKNEKTASGYLDPTWRRCPCPTGFCNERKELVIIRSLCIRSYQPMNGFIHVGSALQRLVMSGRRLITTAFPSTSVHVPYWEVNRTSQTSGCGISYQTILTNSPSAM